MPIKKIVMCRRKKGLSPEEFRQGYENNHSRLAVELFGHLWTEYRRNYLHPGPSFDGEMGGPDEIGYDAVSEFVLRDEAALAEMERIGTENAEMIKEDELRWFDSKRCWLITCDTVEEDLSEHHRRAAQTA